MTKFCQIEYKLLIIAFGTLFVSSSMENALKGIYINNIKYLTTMITDKLQKEFNVQIAAEMWSANLYMSMAYFMSSKGLDGMASWLKKQAQEETEHAYRFADYLAARGGVIKIDKIDVVPQGWGSAKEVFEHVYKHECHVSKLVDSLYEVAVAEKDYASQDFLMSFVREQVEEEATALGIAEKIKMAGDNDSAMLLIDSKLAARQ